MSEPDGSYPIDIIVGLEKKANIYKIQIGVADHLVPDEIEVQVGEASSDKSVDPTYDNARKAKYTYKGSIKFPKRHRDDDGVESKPLFIDRSCQFIWLVVHGPEENEHNPSKQVRITDFTVYGYGHEKKQKASTRERKNDGDGLYARGDMLAGDPLFAVRMIRSTLMKKREKALDEDREVEATVCLRAVQRLEEYEERMVELKHRMSEALAHNDIDYAERYRLALNDCRDTVFRAIHLDLLLDRHELRAMGMESKWSFQ
ncbi:Protein F28C6.9 a [Aphelenchoides avenae]|nr:Protein F28C6.9 a [Aphelenchus avenae]